MLYLILALCVFAGLFFLVFLAVREIWKTHYVAKIVLLAIGGYFSFSVVTAIWPLSSFYIENLEYHSGIKLPRPVTVLSKTASFPDVHGDYSSEAVFRIDSRHFDQLLEMPSTERTPNCIVPTMVKRHLDANVVPIMCITNEFSPNDYLIVILFSDRETVHYAFHSS